MAALWLFIPLQQPKIQVASKYERRVDTRSYDDKKKLFEGVSIRVPWYLRGFGGTFKNLQQAIWVVLIIIRYRAIIRSMRKT